MYNPASEYTEDVQIEKPSIDLFAELGWETIDCMNEFRLDGGIPLARETMNEVVLTKRLRNALERLNPDLPPDAISAAIDHLTSDRSRMSMVAANRQVYDLLKNGVNVTFNDPDGGGEIAEKVVVIDWNNPENNDFLLVSQFWIIGDLYTRRADLVGFVNGIPLLFIELKAAHVALETAYNKNLSDYKDTIPHLFWYNAFVILSNGSISKIGSITAEWEHFSDWQKINSEGEEGIISLETIIRGTCEKTRFLDIVENFAVFRDGKGGTSKLVTKTHQYFGVTSAIESLKKIDENKGQLGVFWHTQGSGKTVSMIFFAQKVLRKIPGNWTFVLITDRKELDGQIYKEFASCGAVTEEHAQATSSNHLRQLLGEDHRYVFTLIHKFRTEGDEKHPVCSDRSDIVVITDEAHRSQYDKLAMNMRNALPNAAFIAFTGTPLIAGEEKTREVFGDYISIYNFKQSIDDKATVPLYYENRKPELQLKNEDLNDDVYAIIEDAELDEEQEKKLEREFARQYHLITRDDRLDEIAKDMVSHFMGRGFRGKGMFVCIDKATAVKMYDKVQIQWKEHIKFLKSRLAVAKKDIQNKIHDDIIFMEETDMAVVVSSGQNEVAELKLKGVDIIPHRKRIVSEDLETKFKDEDDKFRIVFVCAMWMTGFDVPSCSTIYLDKPMRNHTLMQTIARANRVFGEKQNGLIVDYVGVFQNLQKALAIYGAPVEGGVVDTPVRDKSELIEELKMILKVTRDFCDECGADIQIIIDSRGFDRVEKEKNAANAILLNDESKKKFLHQSNLVKRIYKAILPDPQVQEFATECVAIVKVAAMIRSYTVKPKIEEIMADIEEILDESIATEGFLIDVMVDEEHIIDLSKIDFDALAKRFKKGHKGILIEQLKNQMEKKISDMVAENHHRLDFHDRFKKLVDEYNSGSINIEKLFDDLLKLSQDLSQEEQRHIEEGLTEEELALFDKLTKPEIDLSEKDKKEVKVVCRLLLDKLKAGLLTLDWRKRQQSRAAVKLMIEEELDKLPEIFSPVIFQDKCESVYHHVYESYYDAGRSVYSE